MMGYLGFQGTTRKSRPITQSPGEWTGYIVIHIEGVGFSVTVSQRKWYRVKVIVESIVGQFIKEYDRPEMDLKYLNRKVGFIVHFSMAYPLSTPFLKGLYRTMDYWR